MGDPEGRNVILMAERGMRGGPPFLVKERLQREFGLYPKGGNDPFGEEILEPVWGSDPPGNIHMFRAESVNLSQTDSMPPLWNNPFVANFVAKNRFQNSVAVTQNGMN